MKSSPWKASGSASATPLAVATVFSIICLLISLVISPNARYKAEQLSVPLANAPDLTRRTRRLHQARPNATSAAGSRVGDELEDIHHPPQFDNAIQDIVAKRGRLISIPKRGNLNSNSTKLKSRISSLERNTHFLSGTLQQPQSSFHSTSHRHNPRKALSENPSS